MSATARLLLAAALLGLPAGAAAAGGEAGGEADRAGRAPAAGRVTSGSLPGLKALLEDLRGRPVVLNFWATWCVPCVKEVPVFNEALVRFAPRRLAVIGVALDAWTTETLDEARGEVLRFVEERDVRYDVFFYEGEPEPLEEAFDLPGPIPFTLVLDGEGKVKRSLLGNIAPETLLGRISEALDPPPSAPPQADGAPGAAGR